MTAFVAALIASPGFAQNPQASGAGQQRPNEGVGSSMRTPAVTGTGAAQGQTDPGSNAGLAPGSAGTPGGMGTAGASSTGQTTTNPGLQGRAPGTPTAVPEVMRPAAQPGTTSAMPPATATDATGGSAARPMIQPQGTPSDQRAGQSTGTVMPGRDGAMRDANAPVPGANSFTEGQARGRAEARGFTEVGELTKDDNGIWRGRAMQNGRPVEVLVDFQGNVTAR